MSANSNIRKGSPSIFHAEGKPYTAINNVVITSIQNPEALAIWVYLQSKTNDWQVIGTHLMKHFGIGRDRYRRAMRLLADKGLIAYQKIRCEETGRMLGERIIVNYDLPAEALAGDDTTEDAEHRQYRKPASRITGEPENNPLLNNRTITKEKSITKPTPNPAQGRGNVGQEKQEKPKRANAVTLKTFIDDCIASNEKPISAYKPLLEYIEASNLPMEFVQLAWERFKAEFLPGGVNQNRRQRDWRRHFYNYVTKGYYRLWWAKEADGGGVEYQLTSQGLQTKQVVDSRRESKQ